MIGRIVSTRRLEPTLDRTIEQELHQALIAPPRGASQQIFARLQAFDFKLLAGQNVVLPADHLRHHDLALAGNDCFHQIVRSRLSNRLSDPGDDPQGATLTPAALSPPPWLCTRPIAGMAESPGLNPWPLAQPAPPTGGRTTRPRPAILRASGNVTGWSRLPRRVNTRVRIHFSRAARLSLLF
jgi:hypothetical protein